MKTLRIILIYGSLLVISGCAGTQFQTSVSSLTTAGAQAKKHYLLLPTDKNTSPDDLQFKEYAHYVDKALAENGFTKETELTSADVIIFLTYLISDPKTYQETYSMPIFGQTGVSSSTTYGSVSSSGYFSGTTTYTPTYGVTGYSSGVVNRTIFSRAISLDAIDAKAFMNEKIKGVWRTSAVSTGSSGDLRLVFPYIIASMEPYIATNTGKNIVVNINENDPAVEALRTSIQSVKETD
jgi:hypothetical protein